MGDRFDVAGQAVIVTGASSGLGRIMAAGYAAAGCDVVITARRETELSALAAEISESGGRAVAEPHDVRDPGHAEALVERCRGEFGRLDGIVLNAGAATGAPAEDEDMDTFADVLDVNLTAQMRLAAAGARGMIDGGGGWMILLSSILGKRAGTGPGVAAYVASKGAIEMLTRELARQWAPHGIRVNALAPGYFPTAMNATMVAGPGRLEALMGRIPLGREGRYDDLVGPALFLASPAAAYVTGASLALDGGMGAW